MLSNFSSPYMQTLLVLVRTYRWKYKYMFTGTLQGSVHSGQGPVNIILGTEPGFLNF
jgi:hypothetical protein